MHLTLDWKRFVTDRTVDFMKQEISAIRAGGSELPATANLMYDYNGLDYKKFKDVMDIASWDNYPSWHKKDNYTTALDGAMQHDLMRSIKKDTVSSDGILSLCDQLEAYQQAEKTRNTSGCFSAGSCSWFRQCSVFPSFVRVREPLRNSMVR